MASVGESSTLEAWRDGASGERTLLVVGAKSFQASGAAERLNSLTERGTQVISVSGPLPTTEEIDRISSSIRASGVDEVAGIGGGLVIDTMKLASLAAATGMSSADLIEAKPVLTDRSLRTIAIPTTAGSGAERTPFAVVYRSGVKHSVDHPLIKPDIAILEPDFTYSMPRPVAASSGLDAIAHCVESSWSIGSTPASREIALEALNRLWGDVEAAVLDKVPAAMTNVAVAASAAGEAIAVTRTTAAHAMSYYLTSRLGVAHGHAVALLLPTLILRIGGSHDDDLVDERGPTHLRGVLNDLYAAMGTTGAEDTARSLRAMVERLGLPTSLISTVDVEQWVSEVNPERLSNNPVRLTRSDLEAMARAA